MSDVTTITTAVIISARQGAQTRLRRLLDLFAEAGISVAVVETAEEAAARLLVEGGESYTHTIMLDADSTLEGDLADGARVDSVVTTLKHLRETVPLVPLVVVSSTPPAELMLEAFRAGAADFIDLHHESDAGMLQVLDRIVAKAFQAHASRDQVNAMRDIVDEFLRELVQTERRSIDLEHKLKSTNRGIGASRNTKELDEDREPVILILEDDTEVANLLADRLEDAGVSTFAFVTGEEAVLNVKKMARKGEALDLAIVDANLPGIDGLEAIRQMRQTRPNLAAILMTGFSNTQTAIDAADIGVIGYVLKPFDDVSGLVERMREQATRIRDLSRERHYLRRIKDRHEDLLIRYRRLAASGSSSS